MAFKNVEETNMAFMAFIAFIRWKSLNDYIKLCKKWNRAARAPGVMIGIPAKFSQ